MENIVLIDKLTKYYSGYKGIEDISFSIEAGEIFGVAGATGAGKSTLIRTLLALLKPTSGSAIIMGKDSSYDRLELANDIGYLPENTFYYPNMKIRDLFNYTQSLYKKDCTKKYKDLSRNLDLDLSSKIKNLDSNDKKKVNFIASILHSPKLIILDEPMYNIDGATSQAFYEILKQENEAGASILYACDSISEIQKLCNRMAILHEGNLLDIKNIEEINENGYKRVTLTAQKYIPIDYLSLPSVTNLVEYDNHARFMYKGDINDLLAIIWQLKVTDVSISELNLDDLIATYYLDKVTNNKSTTNTVDTAYSNTNDIASEQEISISKANDDDIDVE